MPPNKKVQRTVNRIASRNIAPEALTGKGTFQKRIKRAAASLPGGPQRSGLKKIAKKDLAKARQRVATRAAAKKVGVKKTGKR